LVSAVNNNSASSSSAPGSRAPFSGSPIAHEAAVIATGARTDDSGKRELFKETTSTALVFPHGGVIRLSAAAAPGQLLFLTNPQTRREVVAQVTRRRSNPGAGYYIELEFTESAPDFWGVTFPEAPAQPEAASTAPQAHIAEPALAPAAAEFLQPAEPGSDDLGPNAPAPSADEVNLLMEEVEALRAQLKSMQTQAANPGSPTMQHSASQAHPSPAASAPPANAPDLGAMLSSLANASVPRQDQPTGDAHPPSLSSAPPATHAEPSSHREPAGSESEDENLLPKPALDFKAAKVPPPNSPAQTPLAPASDHTGMLRLALLAVVSLFAVMVAAWNMHLLPWLSSKSVAPNTIATAQPTKKPPPRPAATPKTDAHATSIDPSAATPPAATAGAPSPVSSGESVAASPTPSGSANSASTDAQPPRRADSSKTPLTSVAKHSAVRDSKSGDPDSADPSANDGSLTPPRLIKSVRAIAPGDALRQFMTGNVTLDALIDKTGQVKSMKILSGPPSFHKAAMEALRQYRYEPARQNGKPVSAHLTVTIPFWFEP
jgi:protein TonB